MREYLEQFKVHLASEEKSKATIEKYVRDAQAFLDYAGSHLWLYIQSVALQSILLVGEALPVTSAAFIMDSLRSSKLLEETRLKMKRTGHNNLRSYD